METHFLHYTATHRWSLPALVIDSEQILALIFETDGLYKPHNHTITFNRY